jgi:replicative DNA helicase
MTDDAIPHVPYSPTSEAALIGSLLIDPERIREIDLDPGEFYLETNRWIFEAILSIRSTGKDADYVTICQHLEGCGKLSQIGGASVLMKLCNNPGLTFHIKSYAKIISGLYQRRQVIEEAKVLTMAAFNQDQDLDEAIAQAMDDLSKTGSRKSGAVHISQVISAVYDEVLKAHEHPADIYGIPTGFDDWDAITFGLQRGTVIKIVGEPAIGKSLLAMQVLANAAKRGHPGVLYELEMRRGNVIRRQLSGMSKIPTHSMLQGKFPEDGWNTFTQAVEELSTLPVYIEANSLLTTGDIRTDLHRLKKQAGVELVVIDYEDLLNDDARGLDDNAKSKLRSSRVHGLATDLDMAVISLDDMTKEGQSGKASGTTGMGGSGRKSHDADEVIFMRRDKDKPSLVMLTWEKNREGKPKRFVTLQLAEGYPAFQTPNWKEPNAQNFKK